MTLLWSTQLNKLVLTADVLVGPDGGIWDTYQMNDAGTQWDWIEDLCPAEVAGPWRQTRNSAAIGPDGNIYRGIMSCSVGDVTNFEPMILKHSPGYSVGHAQAVRTHVGEVTDIAPGAAWVTMYATANYRIRIVGNDAYVMFNAYAESWDYDDEEWYADGIFVFKLSYVPCRRFRPQIYRRILG